MHDVAIIDYNMGNLFSIDCALKFTGLNSIITNNLDEIENSKCIILPGVGAFPEAMKRLKEKKLDKAIYNFNLKKKPIVGICLGMQLLFTSSYENTATKGLGILEGEVKKFTTNKKTENHVFNVGWRKISLSKKKDEESLLKNLGEEKMYFIHSYHVSVKDKNIESSSSQFYDKKFTASIKKENIQAFQFHPEKSGKKGIEIYYSLKKYLNLLTV